ncbi:DNA alkylation repair enzyme [hydrothermal vent metagenome]|uniref:DNA alkylation repair enzyme n=1 Tax=hydrothermal vent metagenome TaxID=652676 RepID=A0A1W1CNG5_9ZZZZ
MILKDIYSKDFYQILSQVLSSVIPDFNKEKFIKLIFNSEFKDLELKQRMNHTANVLRQFMPDDVNYVLKIVAKYQQLGIKEEVVEFMFLPEYIANFYLEDYEKSIVVLEKITEFTSCEFAVRAFIKKYPQMMEQMKKWSLSSNQHIRRLASEGCRPRLPWAIALPQFKNNPQAVLSILENLKNDESEYVRRSVANNLNDISKDNPNIVFKIAKNWLGNNERTDKLVKHACRSLLKNGNQQALALFGFVASKHIKIQNFNLQKYVNIGDKLCFSFEIQTQQQKLGKCRLEYKIGFMKANNQLSNKVFKISESDIQSNFKLVKKNHSFKIITTRKYYAGKHSLTIIINGIEVKKGFFELRQ